MKKEVTYSLGYLLDRTLWALSNSLNVALKNEGIDLPHSQYLVLRTLFEKDGLSQNEIAAHLQIKLPESPITQKPSETILQSTLLQLEHVSLEESLQALLLQTQSH